MKSDGGREKKDERTQFSKFSNSWSKTGYIHYQSIDYMIDVSFDEHIIKVSHRTLSLEVFYLQFTQARGFYNQLDANTIS